MEYMIMSTRIYIKQKKNNNKNKKVENQTITTTKKIIQKAIKNKMN